MVEKLGKYKKVYALQREITQSGKEAEKLAETAVNLEQYLQPFIGSFQGLINQVCEQDSTLNGTVNEIQSLVEDIMSSNTGSFMSARADDLSKNMLDFLVTNEQKKERLVMAVEDAQRQGIDWSWQQIDIKDCGDLTQAISALQAHIDGKLGEYSQEIEITPRSPLAPDFKKTLLQKGGNQQGESQEEVFDLGNGVKLEMVYIPAGGFMMGSHEDEDEQPIHKVTFAQGFYMGKYPITQAQYQAVMGNNPSYFSNAKNAPLSKGGWGDFPVENVSWDMAQQFCQQLSRKLGKQFTLPSEAQWEYACRAGTTTPFYFGETLSDNFNS
jgi:formylglycine-generating enzyme required for sulfatase activity